MILRNGEMVPGSRCFLFEEKLFCLDSRQVLACKIIQASHELDGLALAAPIPYNSAESARPLNGKSCSHFRQEKG